MKFDLIFKFPNTGPNQFWGFWNFNPQKFKIFNFKFQKWQKKFKTPQFFKFQTSKSMIKRGLILWSFLLIDQFKQILI